MKNIGIFWVFVAVLYGCSSVKNIAVERDVTRTLNQSSLFSNQFTGFSLFDPEENKFIVGHNETKRFTPASNTKILTMYVALRSFGDSIPGLLYQGNAETLWITPVGEPTMLNPDFPNQPIQAFLSDYDTVQVVWPLNDVEPFGPGWAWDDYVYAFQPQRSWWPLYGNTMEVVKKDDSITVYPSFFENYVEVLENKKSGELVDRELKYNLFKVYTDNDTSDFKRTIPYEYSREIAEQLLSDTLGQTFLPVDTVLVEADTLFTQHLDTLLAVMMKESDNFLAEQLLIQTAWKNGYTSIDPFIKHAKLIWLSDLTDFVWVDGSGLSRYNLIAPVDIVRLLNRARQEFGMQRLQQLLAVGGKSGTLESWYAAEEPYIYAKTGTLSNNHNLSGFLKTRSGKWLIFSFMNNHFTVPLDQVKTEMQRLLEQIRDAY